MNGAYRSQGHLLRASSSPDPVAELLHLPVHSVLERLLVRAGSKPSSLRAFAFR